MCTVSFIPHENFGFVLTSNRDEAPNRDTIPPDIYEIDDTKMLFPKDKQAGGTWIGLSDKKRLICLLNGGFTNHKRQDHYRLSRGVVVRDMMATQNIEESLAKYELYNIEPFTLIVAEWQSVFKLYELVWDGKDKHFSELPLKPRMWSSSSLYDARMKKDRQDWFDQFLRNKTFSPQAIRDFHLTAGTGNDDYGVVMDRGYVKTTSMTQIVKSNDGISMSYRDLKTDEVTTVNFEIHESVNE